MNFGELCSFFEEVRKTKGLKEKSNLTKQFWKTVRSKNYDLYPIVRLILPNLDRDRPSYRLKESKISRLLVKMLGLTQGNDKNTLLNAVMSPSLDFGDIVHSVIKKYIVNQEKKLSILEIHSSLDKIAARTSDTGLDDLILDLFRKLSPQHIKWLIQIILKDLKLGISNNTLLNCFHEDGAKFYASNNNLRKLCEVLKNPETKLHVLEITLFEAFRPMLSKRGDAGTFRKSFPDEKTFFVENKFDGERFQLHMENGKFKYFSRNGFDFTHSYGESFKEGSFTPLLKNVFNANTKKVILDGEMMLWNKHTQDYGSKGMNYDVKKLTTTKYQPCFCAFDILLHNDEVLTNHVLSKRLAILKNVVKNPIKGTILISEYKEARTKQDIIDCLNDGVDKNEEGIIVKDPKSFYKCSERNSGWYKLKMEYFDDVVHDLDVLVMGGYYGANKKISSLMVGIVSGSENFMSLGSISSGLNNEQLDILTEKFQKEGVQFTHFTIKTEGKLLFGRETPDAYLEPENSYVLQIRASELTRNTSGGVKCPYTLRFPRVLKIRDDKRPNECVTLTEILELASQNKAVIKLNKRHIELEEIMKQGRPQRKKAKLEVARLDKREGGSFLQGKLFYVDSGTDHWPVEDIYYSIKKSGGNVVYRLEPNIDIILVSKLTNRISSLMKQVNSFDIIHVDWLQRVLEEKQLLNYNLDEVIYHGANFRRDFSMDCDKFGDSFTGETSKHSLVKIFEKMDKSDIFLNANMKITRDLFKRYIAYFDCFKDINNNKSEGIYYSFPDEIEFMFYGGTVKKELTSDVNLVILKEESEEREALICKYLEPRGGTKGVEIVCKNFLKDKLDNL